MDIETSSSADDLLVNVVNKSWTSSLPLGSPWTTSEVPTASNESRFVTVSDYENATNPKFDPEDLPSYLVEMSPTSRNCVMAYIVLFIISATGNLSVFLSVIQQFRKTKSRICVLILHLSIADLMVTFFVMPIEIFWRISVGWRGGNILCKICQFLRAFGLYLSSMVLICISLDRYFAIIHPLRMSGAKRRGRTMLAVAWIVSALCSLPQSIIFRTQTHPNYPSFTQCVSLNFFHSPEKEVAYNVTSLLLMYILPLLIVIFTCSRILYKLARKSRQQVDPPESEANGKILLRRSGEGILERAKFRTLRLTSIIILVFVLCWTPYAVITLWYMFDRENASKLNPDVQEGLFIMAVANSCLNPLVYGFHTKECRTTFLHCCCYDTPPPRELTTFNITSKFSAEQDDTLVYHATNTGLLAPFDRVTAAL